jgi:predicted nucleic acid-binding protein
VIAFFDASALIYLVEGAEPFAGRVRAELALLHKSYRRLAIAVSRLSWLECRVRPARENNVATLALYDEFFSRPDTEWIELSRGVVELGTEIRIKHALRTPDSLQAACGLQLAGHRFITGDALFRKVPGLKVVDVG